MTNAAVWCCGTCGCAGCVHPPCLQGEIDYTVRYPSIGRPKFNTNPQHYAGVLWPAWWNVIARTATLNVDITFTLTPPLPALPISFRIEGDLGLAGTNGNQDANIFSDSWGQYPTMPCGPWPYAIVLCGTGPAVDDAPITAGNNPVWWPYRNRYLIPRWQGNLKMTRNSVVTYEPTTLDYPIAVIANHTTCNRTGWEYGATQGAYGFDLCIPDLITEIDTLLPAAKIGSLTKAWIAPTTDCGTCPATSTRLRIIRGITQEILADQVLRFGEQRKIIQNGTERIGGLQWAYAVDATLTPNGWCVLDDRCGCGQSYSEQGACTLSGTVTVPLDPKCGNQTSATAAISLGLEAHEDSLTPTWEFTNGYLGCRPFEAAMPAAGHVDVPYRQKWNWGLSYDGVDGTGRPYWKMPCPAAGTLFAPPPGCAYSGFGGGCTPVTLVNGLDFFCCYIGDNSPPNPHGKCGTFKFDFGCDVLYDITICDVPPLSSQLYTTLCSPMYAYWPAHTKCSPATGSYSLYCSDTLTTGNLTLV